jgi:hypothetical protein
MGLSKRERAEIRLEAAKALRPCNFLSELGPEFMAFDVKFEITPEMRAAQAKEQQRIRDLVGE